MKKYLGILIIFGLGLGIGSNYQEIIPDSGNNRLGVTLPATQSPIAERIKVCFTPPAGCGQLIAKEIDETEESIYLQAYGLTHQAITEALIRANDRGVKINVLLDRSNLKQGYSKMKDLQAAGINVKIDKVPGIAHNKVMILDEKKVITGSFNFTAGADTRNAENVLIINDFQIAAAYLGNWLKREAKAIEQENNNRQEKGK